MSFDEFKKQYMQLCKESKLTFETSDEELAKLFISTLVFNNYQVVEMKKAIKKEKAKAKEYMNNPFNMNFN